MSRCIDPTCWRTPHDYSDHTDPAAVERLEAQGGQMKNLGKMLTLAEAAASLGIGAASLRHQIADGKLAAAKVGPNWIVKPSEVERYRRDSLGKRKAAAK